IAGMGGFELQAPRGVQPIPSEAAGERARNVLPIKNTLSSRNGRLIETAFAFRVCALQAQNPQPGPRPTRPWDRRRRNVPTTASTKSVLAFREALRDKDHLKYVASRSCLICGRRPSEPHHMRFAQKLAFGRKVSDEFTVPLCRLHHLELHPSRNEPLWWKTARIDPLPIAQKLWQATRPQESADQIIDGEMQRPHGPAKDCG